MPVVNDTVTRPDGSPATDVVVSVELAGSNGKRVQGYVAGVAIEGLHRPIVDEDGAWSVTLEANADISPAGTVWKVIKQLDGKRFEDPATVPDGVGPYDLADILEDGFPGAIPSIALRAHLDDTVDAHDASAISYTGTTGITATDVESALDEIAAERTRTYTALTLAARDALTGMAAGDLCVVSNIERTYRYDATNLEWRPLDYDTGIVNVLDYGALWSNADNASAFQAAIDDTIEGGGTRDAKIIGIPQPVRAGGNQQAYAFTTAINMRGKSRLTFKAIGGNVTMPYGRRAMVELVNLVNSNPIIDADNEADAVPEPSDNIFFDGVGFYGAASTPIKTSWARSWTFQDSSVVTFGNAPAIHFQNSFWLSFTRTSLFNTGTTTGVILLSHESGMNPDIDACALVMLDDCITSGGPVFESHHKSAPSGGSAGYYTLLNTTLENVPATAGAFLRTRRETAASGEAIENVTFTNVQWADPTSGSAPWTLVSTDPQIILTSFIFDNARCGQAGTAHVRVRGTNAAASVGTYTGFKARGGSVLNIIDSLDANYAIQAGFNQQYRFGSQDVSYATAGTTTLSLPMLDGNGQIGHLFGVRGEAAARLAIGNDGYLMWGDGTITAPDAHIVRSATATLSLKQHLALTTDSSSAASIVAGTTNGLKVGTSTSQKLGFFNATPAVQPAGTTDVVASLVTLGLRAASSNPPLNLGTGAITSGAISTSASLLLTTNNTYYRVTRTNAAAYSALGQNGSDVLVLQTGGDPMSISAPGGLTIVGDATTGIQVATAASQKLGFWGATRIVQPTTGVAAATLVGGGGAALTDTDTFDGYTIKQVVKALRNEGLLA